MACGTMSTLNGLAYHVVLPWQALFFFYYYLKLVPFLLWEAKGDYLFWDMTLNNKGKLEKE